MSSRTAVARSRGIRAALCAIAICAVAMGAGTASASAAPSISITPPSNPRPNQLASVTLSGNADVASYVRVFQRADDGTPCGDFNTSKGTIGGPDGSSVGSGSYTTSGSFAFPAGNRIICAYLFANSNPDSGPADAVDSKVITVSDPPAVGSLSLGMSSPTTPGQHPLTYSGSIDRPAHVTVFSHPDGTACGATQAAEQAIAGSQQQGNVAVASGSFNNQMQVSWTSPGTYRLCGYLYGDDHLAPGDPPVATSSIVVAVASAPAATGTVSLTLPHDPWTTHRSPITISGSSSEAAYVEVWSQPESVPCGASFADEQNRGAVSENVNQVASGSFSIDDFIGLKQKGTYRLCGYVFPNNSQTPSATTSTVVTAVPEPCPSAALSDVKVTWKPEAILPVITAQVEAEGDIQAFDPASGKKLWSTATEPPLFTTSDGDVQLTRAQLLAGASHVITIKQKLVFAPRLKTPECSAPDGSVHTDPPKSKPQVVTFEYGNPNGGSPAARALAAALTPSGSGAKIGNLLKAGKVASKFKAPSAGKLAVSWTYKPASPRVSAAAAKTVTVASGATKVKKKGKAKLVIKLTKAGKALLKGKRKIVLTASGTFAPKSGSKIKTTKAITLRR